MNRRELLKAPALALGPRETHRLLACEKGCGKTFRWPLYRAHQPRRWICSACWDKALAGYAIPDEEEE